MKSILFLTVFISLGLSNVSLANSYEDTLKSDLEYLFFTANELDLDVSGDDRIVIDQEVVNAWVIEHFGSQQGFTDIFNRINSNLNIYALDNNMSNNSIQDKMELIFLVLDIDFPETSEALAPFKCYNRYLEDFTECIAAGLLGSVGGGGVGVATYLLCVGNAKRNFHRCLEDTYGN